MIRPGTAGNFVIVIFGASGDLTRRKLIPALFELYCDKLLGGSFAVLGIGRTALDDAAFREAQLDGLRTFSKNPGKDDPDKLRDFAGRLFYQSADPNDRAGYTTIRQRLDDIDTRLGTGGNYLFYMSTPPALAAPLVSGLGAERLSIAKSGCWRRVIVEKPFGTDLQSARALNEMLLGVFREDQIFRIDHYLGKETVQNILVFRFANGMFEPVWNRNYVDHVEITAAEDIGVEQRGGYYDAAGALRDMVQNHLLQVTAMAAMEPPSSFDARAVRNETMKVFQSLRPIEASRVHEVAVRGQYTESKIRGKQVPGYRQEKGVAAESRTETYVALKVLIDNWRWGGVPFYIRSGKRLPTRVSEVVIHFRPTPHKLFAGLTDLPGTLNQLIMRVQPDEGIVLTFGMKVPGAGFQARPVSMDFHYSDLAGARVPEAYERLLLDCLVGDATLFTRGDAVEACWSFIEPILDGWRDNPEAKIFGYPAGTWGPLEAEALLGAAKWRQPCKNLSEAGDYCEL